MEYLAIALAVVALAAAIGVITLSSMLYSAKSAAKDSVLAEGALRTALDAAHEENIRLNKEQSILKGEMDVLDKELASSSDPGLLRDRLRGLLQGGGKT